MSKLIFKYLFLFLAVETMLFMLGFACSGTMDMNKWLPATFTLFLGLFPICKVS